MDLRWRSISRRRRASATLAWSATVPSGRILPSRSLSSARKSPIDWRPRAEAREAFGDGVQHALGVGGAVEHAEEIEDLLGLQAGAFDAQLVDGLGEIGEAAEIDADGCAARGGLGARGGAQIFDGFAGFGQIGVQARGIGVRRDLARAPPCQAGWTHSGRAGRAAIRIPGYRRWWLSSFSIVRLVARE